MPWGVNKKDDRFVQCSLVKDVIIFIGNKPRQKIEFLMEEYAHQEWLAYLVGKQSKKENFFIEDIFIPPHAEASSTSAEAEPFHIPQKCVGVIHSHHSMGAFHSATDKEHVDQNFPISITVAKRNTALEFDAVSYRTTLCGKVASVKGEVKYVQPTPLFNKAKFLRKAKANIEKGKKIYTVVDVKKAYEQLGVYEPETPFVPFRYGNMGRQVPLDEENPEQSQEEINQAIKEIQEAGLGFW